MINLRIATSNSAKIERIARLLNGLDINISSEQRLDLSIDEDDKETQGSHLAIAVAKAASASRLDNEITIATDGGVQIPALEPSWCSLHTRRHFDSGLSGFQRADELIKLMSRYEGDERKCYWTEAIAIAKSGILLNAWESQGASGLVGKTYRPNENADKGFWFDGLWTSQEGIPIWQLVDPIQKSEIDPWEKLRPAVRQFFQLLMGA